MPHVSRSGVNETLSVPKHNSDTGSTSVAGNRSMDASFRSLSGNLMSVGRAVGNLQGKVEKMEPMSTDLSEVKDRMSSIESTIAAHTQLLGDIFNMLKLATDPEEAEEAVEIDPVEAVDPVDPVEDSDEEFDLHFDA